ncbi:hypothetical protein ADIARSV_2812 [Arcticibacter svalbardensis MN12-7]|uniref:Methyltransferase, TIGR04325 family n=1 Tax=Arcticibacter svalbardensis MN12-7 TaxID=1150600 RepID=R9GQI1_9SPHI|nr:TIGR04325 family methyltransferase [Arcticibacter svalbardensis]EOR93978.1 hypothetical protein ADIARSV_2812 [Arcticibacter svalbardensis MN12-7]
MIKYFKNKFRKKPKEEYGWFGNYPSWEEAVAHTDGYDKENILAKTKASLLKIKSGEAIYERDSVIFDQKEYPFPLITFLLHSANQKGTALHVLDFGGSLGSTYFQVKEFLTPQICASWDVVEQPHYVSCGKQYFEDNTLHFADSIEEVLAVHPIDLVLLSSVVQYLPEPHVFLEKLVSFGFKYIIIDRTAFVDEPSDRLTIQKVWPSVYEASYPSWFFNQKGFLHHFKQKYTLEAQFTTYVEGESIIEIDHEPIGRDKGFYLVINKD